MWWNGSYKAGVTKMLIAVIPATDCKKDQSKADLEALVQSINPSFWDRVILMADSCEWDFIKYFDDKYPWLDIRWNKGKALNFTKNANHGMKLAFETFNADAIFIINQDSVLPDNSLLTWMADLYKDSIVSPQAVSSIEEMNNKVNTVRLSARGVFGDPVERIAFFCPLIPRAVYEKVGLMDSAFVKVMQDDDYCLRAQLAGFKIISCDVPVYHRGSYVDGSKPRWESASGTYNANDLGLSLAQYQRKWMVNVDHAKIIQTVLKTHEWSDNYRCS
jgi:GT2 family glycosyltransferase